MKILRLIPVFMLLVMVSCENGEFNQALMDRTIRFKGTVENSITRLNNDKWESGDAIGIYMKKSGKSFTNDAIIAGNVKYVTTGDGAFEPAKIAEELKYPLDNKKVDFLAIHPYGSVSASHQYIVDINSQQRQTALDFMLSTNAEGLDNKHKEIELNFERQMAKVVVNLITENSLLEANARVTLYNVFREGRFSLVDHQLVQSDKGDISMKMDRKKRVAEAIVMPAASVKGIEMEIVNGTKGYIFDLIDTKNITELAAGYMYTFNVTLDGERPELDIGVSATVDKWKDGATEDMVLPPNFEVDYDDSDEGGVVDVEMDEPGDGSKQSPYTIVQAQGMLGVKDVWVKGYIVGYYDGRSPGSFVPAEEIDFEEWQNIKDSHIALAASPDETDGEKTFPVELRAGRIREALNLIDNELNLRRGVSVHGSIESYMGLIGMKGTNDYGFID